MLVCAMLAVAGVAAMVTGGVTVGQTLTREPTKAEIESAAAEEQASRWRGLTAGQIFPAEISHVEEPGLGFREPDPAQSVARRVGIAPAARCGDALDQRAAQVLLGHGCRTVLRATYVDAAAARVTTVGIAVMPTSDAVSGVEADLTARGGVEARHAYGLRAVGFPGTVAAGFQDSRRQDFDLEANGGGPYLFLATAGWTDGRPPFKADPPVEEFIFSRNILFRLESIFFQPGDPCQSRGIRC